MGEGSELVSLLETAIQSVHPADRALVAAAQAHLDNLTKPPGSLGRLEELALRYCLATGTAKPVLRRKRIYCFAGDHGVAAEGVSAYPPAVTPQMVRNMLAGGAAINVLSRHVGAELVVVDVGVADALENAPGLCRRKIAPGTANIARGPAMSVEQARRAVEVGIELAGAAADEGVSLLGTGEMGIANTTPATALYAAYLGYRAEAIVGRGTGVDEQGLARKRRAIEAALHVNADWLVRPLDTLAALGGFEIAAIAGLILGGAARRVPVVVDGFISTAGALAAVRLCPATLDYMFFSHISEERGHRAVLNRLASHPVLVAGGRSSEDAGTLMSLLASKPILDLGMRLGEGTGAALAMGIVEAAVRVYNEMATFGSAGVSGKEP
jgi:nicotinate-nucleotide--dimethylbenzimidazole phosphoribosyltransferase